MCNILSGAACAQEAPPPDARPDTVTVIGSQIVGAKPTEGLPVTVVSREQIDAIGPSSGDDLLRSIPQLGDVGFNTTRTIGSINDARGDTASINLRALGTGNTLVLLNGRRMVNHPGTQAENLVPVVTVNANAIPVSGVERVEVLLDGASAIYGADAVAGVVNTVLKKDFEGLTIDFQVGQERGVDANEYSGSFEWGFNSDDRRTNISLFGSLFSRDPVFASERSYSANSDFRSRLPADWANDPSAQTAFNNTSLTSAWGGFDRLSAGAISVNGVAVTDSSGRFHIQPNTLRGCVAQLGNGLCIDNNLWTLAPADPSPPNAIPDVTNGSTRDQELRYDVNRGATVQNGINRENLFLQARHEFDGGLEAFGEAGAYLADSLGYREAAPMLGAVPIVVPASNYWNPFGPVGSPNRLAGSNAPAGGLDISLIAYRPSDAGNRKTEVQNLATRLVAGLRGDFAAWNWESALLYSQADTTDRENRISNTAFQQALALSTPDAYNPFNGGCINDLAAGDCAPTAAATLAAITVPAMRRDRTTLSSWDFKLSRPDALRIWSGDVGVAAGLELRRETFLDNRDPRQDGTVNFTDPLNPAIKTNDLLGNSPSLDTRGKREVSSAFVELRAPLVSPEMNIPLVQAIDLQLAARYENFDTFGDVTKPKVALSWRPFDFLMFRSAWSEGFRAPNLQQEFESGVQRSNTRTDFIRCEAAFRKNPATVFTTSCPSVVGALQSVTSNRQGNAGLQPEESKNLTYGMVFESTFIPPEWGRVTFTADWWRVEQSHVVGIFGDDNHILLDYALRVQGSSNPAVVRAAPTQDDVTAFAGTGLAPVGQILFVNDNYFNLDQRTVQGWDFGFYYKLHDTPVGDFDFRINAALLDKFFQGVSASGQVINAANVAGLIRPQLRVSGQGDLVRNFGRPEWRWTSSLTWKLGQWQAGWFTSYVGDVYDNQIVRASDNAFWIIDSMQTHNLYVQYTLGDAQQMRLRLGVRNLTDEKPPLADTNFGYLGDIDTPSGRFVYGSIRKTF
jgi:outer membrane receptor protein involved in Fe transport